jgi:hypothetical protein
MPVKFGRKALTRSIHGKRLPTGRPRKVMIMIDQNAMSALLDKIEDEKVRDEVRIFIGNTWREGLSEGIMRTRAKLNEFFENVRLDAHFMNWREEVQKSR